jgi:hypothetical protein
MTRIILFFSVLCSLAIAAETGADGDTGGSEFRINKGILNKIYEDSVTEAKVDRNYARSSIEVRPRFSMIVPSALTLSNKYFDIPYADSIQGLPSLSIGIAAPMANYGSFIFLGEARVGYSQKEGLVSTRAKNGVPFQDMLRLHYVPVSAMLRVDYQGFSILTPSLSLGGGAAWLYQSGKLDGIEQGFWIPFVQISPAITLFQTHASGSWFGGLTLGTSYLSSVASDQIFRALSFDVSATFLL